MRWSCFNKGGQLESSDVHPQILRLRVLHFSNQSKRYKSNRVKKTQRSSSTVRPEAKGVNSIFCEIAKILGTEKLIMNRTSDVGLCEALGSVSAGTRITSRMRSFSDKKKLTSCSHGVCKGAMQKETTAASSLSTSIDNKSRVHSVFRISQYDKSPISSSAPGICENAAVTEAPEISTSGNPTVFNSIVHGVAGNVAILQSQRDNVERLTETNSIYHGVVRSVKNKRCPHAMDEYLDDSDINPNAKWFVNMLMLCWRVPHLVHGPLKCMEVRSRFCHKNQTYNMMMHVDEEARGCEAFNGLLERIGGSSCDKDADTWIILMPHCSKSKSVAESMHSFDAKSLAYRADQAVYRTMLKSISADRKTRVVLEFYEDATNKVVLLRLGLCEMLSSFSENLQDVASTKLVEVDLMGIFQNVHRCLVFSGKVKSGLKFICSSMDSSSEVSPLIFCSSGTELCDSENDFDSIKILDVMEQKCLSGKNIFGFITDLFLKSKVSLASGLFYTATEYGAFLTRLIYTDMIHQMYVLDEYRKTCKLSDDMLTERVTRKGDERMNSLKKMQGKLHRKCETSTSDDSSHPAYSMVSLSCETEAIRSKLVPMRVLDDTQNAYDVQRICKILSSKCSWQLIQHRLEKSGFRFTPSVVEQILQKCNACGNAALNFFSWVKKEPGYSHTSETYNMAMKISGHGKDFKYMRQLFYEMQRNGLCVTSDTWTILIMQYGRIGLTDIAMRTFKEMKAAGFKPSRSTYKYLILCLCGMKGRKVKKAVQIFGEMILAGHIPDKELIRSYLGCLCEANELSKAKMCAKDLRKKGFSWPLSYSFYVRALCQAGKLEDALLFMGRVKGHKCRLEEYTNASFVHGFLQMGRLEEALAKIDAMKQAGVCPTVHVYTSLISYFFRRKQVEKALEIFKKMSKEGCDPTVVTHTAVICGYVSVGRISDAWDIFNQLKREGPFPDFKAYSMFITCLCKMGKSEDGMKLLGEMLDDGFVPSTYNFRTVIFGLNREGKNFLAKNVMQKKWALQRNRKFSS